MARHSYLKPPQTWNNAFTHPRHDAHRQRVRFIHRRHPLQHGRCGACGGWQEGYGAFTFAAPDLDAVRAYVLNQEEHHRVKTFQEAYVAMLKRSMVAYEERFLGQWLRRHHTARFANTATLSRPSRPG